MVQSSKQASVIWLREKCVVCLSLELQRTEHALLHDVNDLYVPANHGHILITHSPIWSYRTPLICTEALCLTLPFKLVT